jgi:hypothetical protein
VDQAWWHIPVIPAQRQEDEEFIHCGLHSETISEKTKGWGYSFVVNCSPSMIKPGFDLPLALQKKRLVQKYITKRALSPLNIHVLVYIKVYTF